MVSAARSLRSVRLQAVVGCSPNSLVSEQQSECADREAATDGPPHLMVGFVVKCKMVDRYRERYSDEPNTHCDKNRRGNALLSDFSCEKAPA